MTSSENKKVSKLGMYTLIALMGALGALSRYGLGLLIQCDTFPLATLLINIIGCFLLRIIYDYIGRCTPLKYEIVRALGVGFIGAFTTVSTFSKEAVTLLMQGQVGPGCGYILLTSISCLVASALGAIVCEQLIGRYMRKEALRHRR